MKPILSVKNLSKKYHTSKEEIEALKDISFDVYDGEFISIVGPSGCGKSTILSMLCNLISKSSGEFSCNDDISIGYMLQNDTLFYWRTILDNCYLGLEVTGKLNNQNRKYVNSLLKKYGLYEFRNNYPSSLSGGMRQRVACIL